MNNTEAWYILRKKDGTCQLVAATDESPDAEERWGPFTQAEAITRRVGLIRAGKCQPQ